ncbi:MAG TPA: hypothetical protein VG475_17390, partial [Pseudolabrys sp.]|nr:hypothetical protein [Pseudolabrys sp.]
LENDEDFVGLGMAVARRSIARTGLGCKCPQLSAGLARRQKRFVAPTIPIDLSARRYLRLHLSPMGLV